MLKFIEKYRKDIINHNISEEFMEEFCDFLLELEDSDRYDGLKYVDKLYEKLIQFMYIPQVQCYYLYVTINGYISSLSMEPNIIDEFLVYEKEALYIMNRLKQDYKMDYNIDIDITQDNLKLENLLLKNSLSNIVRKYAVTEDLHKEIENCQI